jgi:hypothetical protein
MPNGDLVVAFEKSDTTTVVCTLKRAATACTHSVTLTTLAGDDVFGTVEAWALSNTEIVVLEGTCCDADPNSLLLYTSTDGGAAFGSPARVGSDDVSIGAAALVGDQLVTLSEDSHEGAIVQSIATDATTPASGPAIVNDNPPIGMGVGSYKGGVLIGNNGTGNTTNVEYAPSGMDFNAAGSYTKVGSFSHEAVRAMSGNALLTQQTNGKDYFELRFFNGTSFGSPHTVPGYKGSTLGSWLTMDQVGGVTHLFLETNYEAPIYDLMEISTSKGTHWSGRTNLGNAIASNTFAAGLDSNGSGLVLGTGASGSDARGYPVLATQSVSFSLTKSSIHKGKKIKGKGKGSAASKGRKIELQIEKKGLWYNVASTKESSSGAFSFTIKGSSVGTFHYRAVANDHAGYVQYGYSSSRSLKVKK